MEEFYTYEIFKNKYNLPLHAVYFRSWMHDGVQVFSNSHDAQNFIKESQISYREHNPDYLPYSYSDEIPTDIIKHFINSNLACDIESHRYITVKGV